MARKRKTTKSKKACKGSFLDKPKKRLSQSQEFEIMKMVLNKFLWLGFIIMAFGLYIMLVFPDRIFKGLSLLIVGAIVLILFTIMIVREYEIIK